MENYCDLMQNAYLLEILKIVKNNLDTLVCVLQLAI